MRSGIEGIAFDLDGTLYPNYRLNIRLVPFIMKELRLIAAFGKARVIIRKEQEKGNLPQGCFYDYQAKLTAKLLSVNAEQLKEKIDKLIYRGWEPMFKNIKLFKKVTCSLSGFRKAGYKLGLLSDFPPEKKLEYLGLSKWGDGDSWDAVLCSERCGALKPHSLSFKELAAAMKLPCEKILYVGNSHSYDVTGAAAAGMKTAWIKNPLVLGSGNKKPKADFSFHNYRQLYSFMIH
ncbi:MAG: HAD family hydrolase [Treponema sp.]|nr:HAD family hydrolase [Treponema sp.]